MLIIQAGGYDIPGGLSGYSIITNIRIRIPDIRVSLKLHVNDSLPFDKIS